jgi:hypothetical protein
MFTSHPTCLHLALLDPQVARELGIVAAASNASSGSSRAASSAVDGDGDHAASVTPLTGDRQWPLRTGGSARTAPLTGERTSSRSAGTVDRLSP